jgi:hypothetical protein
MKQATFTVRHPSGSGRIALDVNASLDDLKTEIEKLSGIAPLQQELRAGYPPQLVDETASVAALGGGVIIVSKLAGQAKMIRRVVKKRKEREERLLISLHVL